MSRFREFLNEKKHKYAIEVSVRDAEKAQNLLKDDPQMKYKMIASNYFTFPNEDEMNTALEKFEKNNIEVLESD